MKTERRHDIDWLRVIAIALLLIYHIAIVFQPWAMFVGFVRSEEPLTALWVPMTMLNVWRIPILFFVSGMGLFFAMRKRNYKQLIAERTKRILLPFVFGFIAISPLHMFVFQRFFGLPMQYYPHAGHLWFLGNIFIYVLVFLPVFYLLKNRKGERLKKWINIVMKNPAGPLLISVFFIAEALLVQPQIYSIYAETWHGFFLGAIAFFLGYILVYSGNEFWFTVKKYCWLYLVFGVILFGVRYAEFNSEAPGYLMSLESICWIMGVFGLVYRFMNKPSKILNYLSQAAYPVYIIHMAVLYLGTLIISPLAIDPFLEFILITVFTFLVCFGLYELVIRRVRFLRPLFGLKIQPREVKAPEVLIEKA